MAPRAIQLIGITGGEWTLQREGVELLSSPAFQEPLVVASVVGAARSGKSTVINNLLKSWKEQKNEQVADKFKASAHYSSCTDGIWIWSKPIPVGSGRSLVILDVEGNQTLDRPRNLSKELTCLAYLISNVLVWNVDRAVDPQLLKEVASIREATRVIYTEAFSRSKGGPVASSASQLTPGLNSLNRTRFMALMPKSKAATQAGANKGVRNEGVKPETKDNEDNGDNDSSGSDEDSDEEEEQSVRDRLRGKLGRRGQRKEQECRHLEELSRTVGTRLIVLLQGNLMLEQNMTPTAYLDKMLKLDCSNKSRRTMKDCQMVCSLFPKSQRSCVKIVPPNLFKEEMDNLSDVDLDLGSCKDYKKGLAELGDQLRAPPGGYSGMKRTGPMLTLLLQNVLTTVRKKGILNWGDMNNHMMRNTNLALVDDLNRKFSEQAKKIQGQYKLSIHTETDVDAAEKKIMDLKNNILREFQQRAIKEADTYEVSEINLIVALTHTAEENHRQFKLFLAVKQTVEDIKAILQEDILNWSLEITRDSVMQSRASLEAEFEEEVAKPAKEALTEECESLDDDIKAQLEAWLTREMKKEQQAANFRQDKTNSLLAAKVKKNLYCLRSDIKANEHVITRARAGGASKLQLEDGESTKQEWMVFVFLDAEGCILTEPPSENQEFALYLPAEKKICVTAVKNEKHFWEQNAFSRFWLKEWNLGDKLSSTEYLFRAMTAKEQSRTEVHNSFWENLWRPSPTPKDEKLQTIALYSMQVSAYVRRLKGFTRVSQGSHLLGTCRNSSMIKAHYLFQLYNAPEDFVRKCMQVLREQIDAGMKITVN